MGGDLIPVIARCVSNARPTTTLLRSTALYLDSWPFREYRSALQDLERQRSGVVYRNPLRRCSCGVYTQSKPDYSTITLEITVEGDGSLHARRPRVLLAVVCVDDSTQGAAHVFA